ncbi:MAG: endonuclease [Kiritimatiellia bacterium]
MANKKRNTSAYSAIVTHIFFNGYKPGVTNIPFTRDEIITAAEKLGVSLPRNLGDVMYSYRYRKALPPKVIGTQPDDFEWIIEGAGDAKYVFKLVPFNRILPNPNLLSIKIPDATPEIIGRYALGDEQALLAKVRYNRLIDLFLGATAYSLQNHLRTKVPGIGQIEIDEVYVAIDKHGQQFVVPVQAKGGHDQHGVVQTSQDIAWCAQRLPELLCRPISVQFITETKIAMIELLDDHGVIKVADERHYELVPSDSITTDDLKKYCTLAKG